jgi:hydrogenase-1 operon protein HyaE
MASPLQRLVEGNGVAVTTATVEGFVAERGPAVLLFTGDPKQRGEAQDIAVVAGELARQVPGLRIGVVPWETEEELKGQFTVTAVPTMIFLQDGKVRSALARLQDWAVYAKTASLVFGKRPDVATS